MDLAADEDVPLQLIQMMMHGLSPAVSRGDAPTDSLVDSPRNRERTGGQHPGAGSQDEATAGA